jgi:hypothetical protein
MITSTITATMIIITQKNVAITPMAMAELAASRKLLLRG